MPDKPEKIERLHIVAPAALLQRIDDWRREQPDLPNVSEAVRRLVDLGLKQKQPVRKRASNE